MRELIDALLEEYRHALPSCWAPPTPAGGDQALFNYILYVRVPARNVSFAHRVLENYASPVYTMGAG